MAQARFFSGVAIPMVLATPIDSNPVSDPIVNLVTGLPSSYPFTVTVDLGIYSGTNLIQEAMLVTAAPVNNGNGTWTLPVTRGYDGTTIQAHSANATVLHTTTGQDSTDARLHIDSSAGVHGLAGTVVGTTDTQTLSGKTLAGAVVAADPTTPMGVADKEYVDAAATAAAAASAPVTGVAGAFSVGGKLTLNGGTATAGSAPVLTPTFANGTAAQLSDTTRDYMLYLQCTTSGTALTIAIGPTSTPANTIVNSLAVSAGALLTIRLPAGWYLKWAATSAAFAQQKAIGC